MDLFTDDDKENKETLEKKNRKRKDCGIGIWEAGDGRDIS